MHTTVVVVGRGEIKEFMYIMNNKHMYLKKKKSLYETDMVKAY